MRPKSKMANICVSLSIKDWPCFTALRPVRLGFIPAGWELRSGKGRRNLSGNIGGKDGLQIHIIAALTHLTASIWRSAAKVEQEFDSFLP